MKSPVDLIAQARIDLALAIRRMLGVDENDPTDDPVDDTDTPEKPPEFDGDQLQGMFMIGMGKAPPGGVAVVEVLGATNFETRGFSLAIGVDPELRLVKSDTAPELDAMLGIDDPQTVVRHKKGSGWYENFIQCGIMFFQTLGKVGEMDPDNPGVPLRPRRTIVDSIIPRWTPIFLLHIRVPDDTAIGHRFALECDLEYGQKLDSAGPIKEIDWPSMYNTRLDVKRTGVYPTRDQRVCGFIDVTDGTEAL